VVLAFRRKRNRVASGLNAVGRDLQAANCKLQNGRKDNLEPKAWGFQVACRGVPARKLEG